MSLDTWNIPSNICGFVFEGFQLKNSSFFILKNIEKPGFLSVFTTLVVIGIDFGSNSVLFICYFGAYLEVFDIPAAILDLGT